ncbi:GcvT family protein [Hamadaea tsunoensis]|uniref:GcvT family protein n=1 Tax=Hamadaea tsunoensis TaxID=53368 RepID=UPI0004246E6C|nr:FAD-dependent oxidoreductase [Hamadaea tsunoensis]
MGLAVQIPDRARVVVVGGGIIGTSVAYHLGKLGWTDVVLLERDRLTSGTTWHAAGLMVTFGSLSETSTEMRKYSRDLYASLEAETGLATGLRQCGFIEVAADEGRLEEYRRVAAFNRLCGIDVHEISPREVKELFPLAYTDDLLAGFYVAEDGRVNPVDVTMSLAKGVRQQGVKILEGVPVTGFLTAKGAVTGVRTPLGDIEAEYVVNCAGMWARQLGELAGVNIPLQAAEHYYLITEPIDGVHRDLPVLEDPGSYGYYREEGTGLMVGLFEGQAAPWKVGGIPPDFSFGELPPDWERMTPYLEKAMARIPITVDSGVRKFFCGPESFTPDLAPIVGEAPELRNYFVAAGLNSIGILTGGGLGRAVAQWIVDGRPDIDVTGINIDRLHPYQRNPKYRAARTVEALGMVYQTHFPGRSMQSARGVKRSPVHARLVELGAYFRDVSGWEGADWYAPAGVEPVVEELTWGRQNWFPYWAQEHRAAREDVIVMDMSFMSKFLVQGPDAGRELEFLSANRVDGEPGRITYTQWLGEDGRIEADLTVSKLDDERFLVVASDTAHGHVLARLRRRLPYAVTDVTDGYAQLNVQGPRSRELLSALTSADLSNEAFPFRTVREIDLGYARVLCVRITYLGELGYELYIPTSQALDVWDRLVAAGARPAGLKALASLRMEKGYRDYGHDIDNTDGVDEAGLGFAVDLSSDFVGRDAVIAARAAGPLRRRLVQVLVKDPTPLLFHGEVVRRDGIPVGYIRAASYGFTLGGAVGLAMVSDGSSAVDGAFVGSGEWTVEIAGAVYPAEASLRPFYDPTNARIRS